MWRRGAVANRAGKAGVRLGVIRCRGRDGDESRAMKYWQHPSSYKLQCLGLHLDKGDAVPDPSPWISVGELAHAFAPDSNAPQPTADLAGKKFTISLENGQTIEYLLRSSDTLAWKILEGFGKGLGSEESCSIFKIREEIYFLDYVRRDEPSASVTLVLDVSRKILTALFGRLPETSETKLSLLERISVGMELTDVDALFLSGAIDVGFTDTTRRHLTTDDLVGRRVEYTYSPTEKYEHIYLNERFYTWHCLLGSEKGLADTDRCHYLKVAEELYLFVWREKIVPTLGVVMVDFDRKRTAGKIFGYEGGESGKVANFPVGAVARLLNITRRD
jgi:hypothetical protein